MKIDNLPVSQDAISGKLVSNKRVQQWEQEFLNQQRRYAVGDSDQQPSRQRDSAGGRHSSTVHTRSPAEVAHGSARAVSASALNYSISSVPGERVAGTYKQMGEATLRSELPRSGSSLVPRDTGKKAVAVSQLRVYLQRFKGHLVLERDGLVSIWLGRALSEKEKEDIVASIREILADSGMSLERITFSGLTGTF